MRPAPLLVAAISVIACEPSPQSQEVEQAPKETAESPAPERVILRPEPVEQWPPPIPGLLITTLQVEREGSIGLPNDADELVLHSSIALGGGLAMVGEHARRQRWIGFVSETGEVDSMALSEGAILAAISDGERRALLAGSAGSAPEIRGWLGVLDARGKLTWDREFEEGMPTQMVELLPGHDSDERALMLGDIDGQGWVISLGARGAVRWRGALTDLDGARVHAVARLHGERGDILAVGTRGRGGYVSEAWRGTIAGGPDFEIVQGGFEIEGADQHRALDAIVDLGTMGLVALGRAWRETGQAHEQVIAVGFDHTGEPTWSRVLEYFRAKDIYGNGAVNPELPGIANFVVRVPVGGSDDRSALAWLDISPGVDGILVPRQLAGTEGWASAGFIEGRDFPAILAYRQTDSGIDWKVLPLETSYRVGAPM